MNVSNMFPDDRKCKQCIWNVKKPEATKLT